MLRKEQLERNVSIHLSNIDKANTRALNDEVFKANNRLDIVELYFCIPSEAKQRCNLNYFEQELHKTLQCSSYSSGELQDSEKKR